MNDSPKVITGLRPRPETGFAIYCDCSREFVAAVTGRIHLGDGIKVTKARVTHETDPKYFMDSRVELVIDDGNTGQNLTIREGQWLLFYEGIVSVVSGVDLRKNWTVDGSQDLGRVVVEAGQTD